MQVKYQLPSGDSVWVVDTATAAEHLSTMLTSFSQGGTEPLFYGDEPRPQGVVISFDQWVEYERLKEESEADQRIEQLVRDRLASGKPEDYSSLEEARREGGWVTFEEAAREGGWTLDTGADNPPSRPGDKQDQS
jgi:hypothetical protein